MLDLRRHEAYPAAEAPDRLLSWTAPIRGELGIEVALPERNASQRQRRRLEAGASIGEIFAGVVAETRDTYSGALERSE
jgi:carboxylate-amine ligase